MATAEAEASLLAAEACLEAGQPKEALQHCKAALKADKQSVEAFLCVIWWPAGRQAACRANSSPLPASRRATTTRRRRHPF